VLEVKPVKVNLQMLYSLSPYHTSSILGKPDYQPRIMTGTRMSFPLVSQLEGWLVIEHEAVRKTREKREKEKEK
jgi:hypothetical protein